MIDLTDEQREKFSKFTKLQKGMVLGTLEGLKPAEAHKKAGGKCKKEKSRPDLASQVLRHPKVKEFLDEIKNQKDEEDLENAIGSFTHKRDVLIEVMQRCMQHSPVLDKKGNQVMVKTATGQVAAAFVFDHKGVVSSVRELNAMDGDHAAQRVDLGITEDLAALIQQGRNRTNPNNDE